MKLLKNILSVLTFAIFAVSMVSSQGYAQSNFQMRGNVDSANVNCTYNDYYKSTNCTLEVYGWAANMARPNESIPVHLYVDNQFSGAFSADLSRPDVNSALNISGNHGFKLIKSYNTNIAPLSAEKVKVYAIEPANSALNTQLPKSFSVIPVASSTQSSNVLWKGTTSEYNFQTKSWIQTENQITNWVPRTCKDMGGILNETCEIPIAEAAGKQLCAIRYRYILNFPVQHKKYYSDYYKLNGTYNGVVFRQILYRHATDSNNIGCDFGNFTNFYFYDKNKQKVSCTGGSGQCNNFAWDVVGI